MRDVWDEGVRAPSVPGEVRTSSVFARCSSFLVPPSSSLPLLPPPPPLVAATASLATPLSPPTSRDVRARPAIQPASPRHSATWPGGVPRLGRSLQPSSRPLPRALKIAALALGSQQPTPSRRPNAVGQGVSFKDSARSPTNTTKPGGMYSHAHYLAR